MAEVDRAVASYAGSGYGEPSPGSVDVVYIWAGGIVVGDNELLVVGDVRTIVVGHDPGRVVEIKLKWPGFGGVIERSANRSIRFFDQDGAVGQADLEQHPSHISIAVGVEGGSGIAASIVGHAVKVDELVERRYLVTPGPAAIEGEIVSAVIESNAGVVLSCYQILWVCRIDHNHFLGLSPQGTILVHPDVTCTARVREDVCASCRFGTEVWQQRGRCKVRRQGASGRNALLDFAAGHQQRIDDTGGYPRFIDSGRHASRFDIESASENVVSWTSGGA